MQEFETGAVRDCGGKGRMDLLPWCAILRVARHVEDALAHYPERNWENGLPIHTTIDSAFRHLAKYMDGQTDEGKGAALEEQEPQVAEPKPKGAAVDLAERQEEHGKDEYGLYDGYGGFCPGPCGVEQRAVGIEQVSQHTGENRDGECPVPDELQGSVCVAFHCHNMCNSGCWE